MKLPNGYGSVIKLSGKRRKPFAVRITDGYKEKNGKFVQTYKYLEYFEKAKDAYAYLADYNTGAPVVEHQSFENMPLFSEVYTQWLEYKQRSNRPPSSSTIRNYDIAYRRFESLHSRKFMTLRIQDIQPIASSLNDKSEATVITAKTVLNQMYEYAIKREYVEKNYAVLCDWEYQYSKEKAHLPFSDSEICKLWEMKDRQYVDLILMLIYSGLRASEFLRLENKNIFLNEQYMIGGMKTAAGINRIIPIHDLTLPLFKRYYDKNSKYLLTNTKGGCFQYSAFNNTQWKNAMNKLDMNHTMHDTRHTFATLASKYHLNPHCTKLIMGHAVSDLTENVYTHKQSSELLKEINKIKK